MRSAECGVRNEKSVVVSNTLSALRMRAAVLREIGAPLVIEELDVPAPGHGQALVRLVASGICHSQLHEIKGHRGPDRYLPHLLGHEGSGVVEAVGDGVTRVKPGDPVVLSWIQAEGLPGGPVTYQRGARRVNAGALTTLNEYAVVAENRVVPIPAAMPLEQAALLGCAVPTGAGAVFNTADVQPGSTVVVFGAGGIGLNAVQAAALAKAARVIAVDIQAQKLEQARIFGATHAIDARQHDPVRAVLELTDGRGADYAIEAAGLTVTMEQAFACIRRQGGVAVLAGNVPKDARITIDPFELICGKRLVGTWGGGTVPDRDVPRYVALYLEGKLKLDELVTHRFRLEQVNEAFAALERGLVTRALVVFDR